MNKKLSIQIKHLEDDYFTDITDWLYWFEENYIRNIEDLITNDWNISRYVMRILIDGVVVWNSEEDK